MGKNLQLGEQKQRFLRMLPYGIPCLLFYLGDSFCYAYSTLFQQLHGFSTETIGTVGAIACVLTVFAEMIFSRLSDASRSVKRTAILCMSMTACFDLLIPMSADWKIYGFSFVLVILCIRNTIVTPSSTLLDNWILRSSYQEKYDYGATKSMGTVGGVVGSFLTTGVMVLLCRHMEQKQATEAFYYIGCATLVLIVISMLPLHDAPAAEKEKVNKKSLNPLRLFRKKEYLILAVLAFFNSLTVNPCNTFLSVAMTENQLDTAKLGIILGLQSVSQFPALLTFAKMKKRIPLPVLITVSTILCGVTSILRGCAVTMWMMGIAAVTQGISASLQIISVYDFIYQLVPTELRGSGQSYYVICGSTGAAFGVMFAGYAIADWGIRSFYSYAGIATAAIGVLYLAAMQVLCPKRQKNSG